MRQRHDDRELRAGFEPRLRRRLSVGLVSGVLVGAVLGGVIGILAFGRIGAVITTALAGAIAGLAYGAIVGSFAGLESPQPGAEPSDSEHPLSEPAVEEEHPGHDRRGPVSD